MFIYCIYNWTKHINDYDTRRIKRISKRTFKTELYTHRESYRSYLGVIIKIDEEEIDSSVLYDKEKIWL